MSQTLFIPGSFAQGPGTKPGIERVQALADISRSALCCHSNETRAPIANCQIVHK